MIDEGFGTTMLTNEPCETDPLYTHIDSPTRSVVGRPIMVEDLWDYIKEKRKCYNEGFREEYEVRIYCSILLYLDPTKMEIIKIFVCKIFLQCTK